MRTSKKLLSLFLSAVLCLSLLPTAALADGYVAQIEGSNTPYATLADAVADADGGTIMLLQNVTESVEIPAGKTVTLNLNSHNITAGTGDAIVNKGTLTVTGTGTVSTSAANSAALANFPGAEANIEGGTFKSEKWYAIKNLGTMNISGGSVVAANNTNTSSLIANGWYGSSDVLAGEDVTAAANKAKLTISGGDFSGTSGPKSCSVIKNDDYGVLEINGGTFNSTANDGSENAATILNWNKATISGGTFNGSYPISNGYLAGGADAGEVTISSGTFTGTKSLFGENENAVNGGKVTISGGNFTAPELGSGMPYAVEVSGGTFNVAPDADYLASGANIVIDGAKENGEKTELATGITLVGNDTQSVTVKNFAFTTKGLDIKDFKDVTVENNAFTNITQANSLAGVSYEDAILVNNAAGKVSISGNTIDGTDEVGINCRDIKGVLSITKNTVKNTAHNSVQIVGSAVSNPIEPSSATVTGNIFENWGAKPRAEKPEVNEGRALRAQVKDLTFTGNVMINNTAPEQFVKISDVTGKVDLSGNYWGGKDPMHTAVDGSGNSYRDIYENTTTDAVEELDVINYYTDGEMSDLAYCVEAKIGNTYYVTLADAIDAASSSNVTLLKDCSGGGIQINKNLTIDFDGHTYTVKAPAVGSTGTQNQAFQILSGHTVIFKNGTVAIDASNASAKKISRVIQNYANLTLQNMNFSDTNLVERKDGEHTDTVGLNTQDTMIECDFGTVQIKGGTYTVSDSGRFAIAVDDWNGSDYADGTNVTIDGATINGNIRYYSEKSGVVTARTGSDLKSTLTIKNQFNGKIYDAAQAVEGGKITVPAGYQLIKVEDSIYTVYRPSSGGGSSTTKTETTTNADGSKTTTTTDTKTGAVTETTTKTETAANGTKTETKVEVVTQKDGTVTEKQTETATAKNGTTATKVETTDAAGKTETKVEAKVTAAAVTEAKTADKPVTIPVTVESTKSAETAATVSVSVPKSAGSTKVEVPVTNVTAGTVAVLVKADGTEEIIKTSVLTEDGVALKVEGDVQIKIIDNTKEFTDVVDDHWAGDAIDFATSHEIFNGTGDKSFAPEATMTRGMLFTVLARFDDAPVVTTGENWYADSMEWAKTNGVSDGTNPEGSISREQLATMLYRYAGAPAVTGDLAAFGDAATVSDYAAAAMQWAVSAGLINGIGGNLEPQGFATRAQLAAIMQRFCTNVAF